MAGHRASKPAAAILDPKLRRPRGGAQAIFGLIGNAFAIVGCLRMHHRVEAGFCVAGVQQSRERAAGGNEGRIADAEHGGCIRPPDQYIGIDAPLIRASPTDCRLIDIESKVRRGGRARASATRPGSSPSPKRGGVPVESGCLLFTPPYLATPQPPNWQARQTCAQATENLNKGKIPFRLVSMDCQPTPVRTTTFPIGRMLSRNETAVFASRSELLIAKRATVLRGSEPRSARRVQSILIAWPRPAQRRHITLPRLLRISSPPPEHRVRSLSFRPRKTRAGNRSPPARPCRGQRHY